MSQPSLQRPALRDLITLACLLCLFFGATLGLRPYSTPSEARYIEIGREMDVSGDWLTPRLNGVKYFEKPPLFYWVEAAEVKYFGLGEFSGRFATMLMMASLCLVTFAATHGLYGRKAGFFAAGTLATSVLGFTLSRIVLLDVPVSVFLTGCLFSFILAINNRPGKARELLLIAMYVCAALAVLTKGLIGAVLPGLVIGLWVALTGNWALLKHVRLVRGTLLFLVIAVPWHVLVGLENPEFFHFYFIHEHFERFLTTTHHRYQPWWFFGVVVVAGFMPWTFFLPAALREGLRGAWLKRRDDGVALFLLIWIVALFLFFSASHSKLIPYILPIFPPLAAFLGQYFARIGLKSAEKPFKTATALLVFLFLTAAGTIPFIIHTLVKKDPFVEPLVPVLYVYAVFLGLAGVILALMARRGEKPYNILIFIIIYASLQSLIVDMAASRYTKESVKEFAGIIANSAQPADEIVSFHHYYQDLPVYLNRNITVVSVQGELDFGIEIEPAVHEWMIADDEFWQRWQTPGHKMYMVMEKSYLPYMNKPEGVTMSQIADNGRNVLFTNQDTP